MPTGDFKGLLTRFQDADSPRNFGQIRPSGKAQVGISDSSLDVTMTDFDPTTEDLLVQLDAIGDTNAFLGLTARTADRGTAT